MEKTIGDRDYYRDPFPHFPTKPQGVRAVDCAPGPGLDRIHSGGSSAAALGGPGHLPLDPTPRNEP